eukprot:7353-Rhodomonas_salina.1
MPAMRDSVCSRSAGSIHSSSTSVIVGSPETADGRGLQRTETSPPQASTSGRLGAYAYPHCATAGTSTARSKSLWYFLGAASTPPRHKFANWHLAVPHLLLPYASSANIL